MLVVSTMIGLRDLWRGVHGRTLQRQFNIKDLVHNKYTLFLIDIHISGILLLNLSGICHLLVSFCGCNGHFNETGWFVGFQRNIYPTAKP